MLRKPAEIILDRDLLTFVRHAPWIFTASKDPVLCSQLYNISNHILKRWENKYCRFFFFLKQYLPPQYCLRDFQVFSPLLSFSRAPAWHRRLSQTWDTRAHLPVLIQGWRGNISPSINSDNIQTFSICGLHDNFHCTENKTEGNDYWHKTGRL